MFNITWILYKMLFTFRLVWIQKWSTNLKCMEYLSFEISYYYMSDFWCWNRRDQNTKAMSRLPYIPNQLYLEMSVKHALYTCFNIKRSKKYLVMLWGRWKIKGCEFLVTGSRIHKIKMDNIKVMFAFCILKKHFKKAHTYFWGEV